MDFSALTPTYIPSFTSNPLDEIYPNLWLGSLQAAESYETLRDHNITDVISITSHRPSIPRGLSIRRKHFRLRDNTTADLLAILPECIERIEHVLSSPPDQLGRTRRVLVHCRMGISRSGGMVVAYAMKSAQIPASLALEYVRSRRPIVNPNRAFMAQLTVWGECGYDTALLMPDLDPQVPPQQEEEEDEEMMLQRALEMSLLAEQEVGVPGEKMEVVEEDEETAPEVAGDIDGMLLDPPTSTPALALPMDQVQGAVQLADGGIFIDPSFPVTEPTLVPEAPLTPELTPADLANLPNTDTPSTPTALSSLSALTAPIDPSTIPLPLSPPNLHPEQRQSLTPASASAEEVWTEIRMQDGMRRCFEECVRDVDLALGTQGDASAR